MSVEIHPFYEPETGTWSYLLADPATSVAAVIDPVWEFDIVSGLARTELADAMLQRAAERKWLIRWVLETHAHADHLSCASYIREKTGAETGIGRGICAVQKTFKKIFNLVGESVDGSQFDRLLDEGDTLALGNIEIRVLETPGHTNDSVTYLVEDAAFIGDTLFAPAQGTARCDFPGGDASDLYDSIQKLYALPEQTRLYLCHFYPEEDQKPECLVPLFESRRRNIHVDSNTPRDQFVETRTTRDATLALPKLIYPSLQVNIRAGRPPAADTNDVPYLRIPFGHTIQNILEKS